MNSSMIGKIEKAHRYAQEADRVTFNTFDATIRGDNSDYNVRLTEDGWDCSCPTFRSRVLDTCSHVMAMQLMLGDMLRDEDRYSTPEPMAATGN
ncbi:MAG TPA: hypothetical protein VNZ58_03525 [Thermomicrobiales bacterium]|nr:hypothetical protein [Thermomicrobiales bacterium]